MPSLQDINFADDKAATSLLEPLIERAPQIASRVANQRPFDTGKDVMQAIAKELKELSFEERVELFRAHPELAPVNPLTMTGASQNEQSRLGLVDKDAGYKALLDDLNRRYVEKHGFPFITALIRHDDMESVLAEFKARLDATTSDEVERAIAEVVTVSEERVRRAFEADNNPQSHMGG